MSIDGVWKVRQNADHDQLFAFIKAEQAVTNNTSRDLVASKTFVLTLELEQRKPRRPNGRIAMIEHKQTKTIEIEPGATMHFFVAVSRSVNTKPRDDTPGAPASQVGRRNIKDFTCDVGDHSYRINLETGIVKRMGNRVSVGECNSTPSKIC